MTWENDDRGTNDAFTRIVPDLFPRTAERTPLADEPEAEENQGSAGTLYARHYARKVIDDTLAYLGKRGMFALSAGRLTIYGPGIKPPESRGRRTLPQ
jgi:hypothetical protein